MAKTWIVDSETKGTGANVAPLEESQSPPARSAGKLFVDVVSGRVLADRVDAKAAVEALEPVRSIVDVHVSVWQPERKQWRMLGLDELRMLWGLRGS
ncbi:MAG: hypothetical protein ACRDKY_04645 [Solirubrobacteraceae bacterium]